MCNLTEYHKTEIWQSIPQEHNVFASFLQLITQISCTFAQEVTEKENKNDEDAEIYAEAYENTLNAITTLLLPMGEASMQKAVANVLFQSFLHCHLSPPDGIRKLPDDACDDVDELEENDIDKYYCQMMYIGELVRYVPNHSFPMICKFMENRTSQLRIYFEQGHSLSSQLSLSDIFEDLHWLILLSGHVIATWCEGETPLIPTNILNYSISQKSSIDVNTTLRVLGSPHEKIENVQDVLHTIDQVVRLVADMIRLSEMQTRLLERGSFVEWSPQITRDLVSFFKSWVATYLFFDEAYYTEFSPAFSSAFGCNSEGGKWLVNYLISKIIVIFKNWSAEVDLLLETCDLFHLLVDHEERCRVLVECSEFWTFSKEFCSYSPPYNKLQNVVKQKAMRSFVLAGSAKMNLYKDDYWKQTLEPLQTKYKQLISNEWSLKIAQRQTVRNEIASILIMFQGVATASKPDNSKIIFGSSKLLDVYHNYNDLVILILEFFAEVAHKQICYITKAQSSRFYEWSMLLLQCYNKHNVNKRSFDNEDSAQDLTLIVELLNNLLSKDFIDFDESVESKLNVEASHGKDNIMAVDVVLYGLNFILPFVTSELLLYPSFCGQYFKLITFLCELFPEKVGSLSEPMLHSFIHTLQAGLTSYGPDNCKLCLEAIEGLTTQCTRSSSWQTPLHHIMPQFIRLVFDSLIVHSGEMDLLRTAGETFYSLFCFQPHQTTNMFQQIIESQSDDSSKHRLAEAFHHLVPDMSKLSAERTERSSFLRRLELVILNIRGILRVK